MEFLITIYSAITSRMSGGGLGARHLDKFKLTWLPELMFALPFGLVYPLLFGINAVTSTLAFVFISWSYIWMQSATAPGLHWGKGGYDPNRSSTLKPFVDWLANKVFGVTDASTADYCRIYMGVKGFLIGLPVGGLPLAILWPLGYNIANKSDKDDGMHEVYSGFGAGLSIYIFYEVIKWLLLNK